MSPLIGRFAGGQTEQALGTRADRLVDHISGAEDGRGGQSDFFEMFHKSFDFKSCSHPDKSGGISPRNSGSSRKVEYAEFETRRKCALLLQFRLMAELRPQELAPRENRAIVCAHVRQDPFRKNPRRRDPGGHRSQR